MTVYQLTASQKVLAKAMKEADLQRLILQECKQLGMLTMHPRHATLANQRTITPVAGDGKGFPDLLIVTLTDGVWFRELKSQTGSLDPAQKVWRDALLAAGANWALWRPSDWYSGLIPDALLAAAGKRRADR